jgi:ribosomal protein S18 acetylase RimI-like enzyme
MSLRVRPAHPDDAPFIVDSNCRMARETENLALERDVVQRGVRAVLEDQGKGLYFIAELDGHAVGQLMITYEWSDWRNGNIWWIQSVYVVPECRRKGAFTALYRHVEELSTRAGAAGLRLYVEENNAAAQDTYSRLGMKLAHYRVMTTTSE